MPKKVLFSKEVILDTAFKLFKEEGYDAISARNVAKALDSSPAPIYKSIGSMEVLKAELVARTKKLFVEYLLKERTGIKLFDIGMGVCVFAREEKQLFLQIFSRHTVKSPLIDEFLNVIREELKTDERIISIDKDKQEELLHTCWVFAHGLSTLIAIDFFKDSSDEFIERSLKNGPARLFYEYLSRYSKKQ